jgi:DNA recombination protein RmuC
METFFISLFIILFSGALGLIAYTLYGMSKKMPTSSDDKEDLLKERATNIAVDAAKKALDDILKQNAQLQKKDWESYKKDIDSSLTPISKTVKELDDRIEFLQKERKQELGSLETSIKNLLTTNNELRGETVTLSQALKSSSVQGKWGEVQMQNIVEKSGMINHVDFTTQKGTEKGDSIPDMVIKLPNGGVIPVDSKCPMNDFRESLEAEDETERERLQIEHAKKCRGHMRALYSKKYQDQYDSPIDFVIMLIPFEPGFQAALMHDGNLFNDGAEMKVFIVSPISIMPLLNLISETWRQMELTKNADDVINTAKELSKRLKKYEDLYDLGKAYNDSVSSYNSRLKPSVRDIQKLQGIEVDKTKLEDVNLDVKPVIERIAADTEEE